VYSDGCRQENPFVLLCGKTTLGERQQDITRRYWDGNSGFYICTGPSILVYSFYIAMNELGSIWNIPSGS
jgi:hypothetical protein